MRQHRKTTAWKKNRKFGDIHGGRMRLKCADGIFNRQHNLQPPTADQERPIYIIENPSRDFYFPATIEEIKEVLSKLPIDHTKHLTHIWLDKIKRSDYLKGTTIQGQFICGSSVYLVKLYAVPTDKKCFWDGQSQAQNN